MQPHPPATQMPANCSSALKQGKNTLTTQCDFILSLPPPVFGGQGAPPEVSRCQGNMAQGWGTSASSAAPSSLSKVSQGGQEVRGSSSPSSKVRILSQVRALRLKVAWARGPAPWPPHQLTRSWALLVRLPPPLQAPSSCGT